MWRYLPSLLLLVPVSACWAWYGHEVTEGPLKLTVDPIEEVTDPAAPTAVVVRVANAGRSPVSGDVEIRDLVDGWRPQGDSRRPFVVPAGTEVVVNFRIVSGPPVYSALYPVHVYASFASQGQRRTAHAVRIFRVRMPPRAAANKQSMRVIRVSRDSSLPLWRTGAHRVAWRYYEGDMTLESPGWTGTIPQCKATMTVSTITRGDTRACIQMHPPWRPGGGTIFCDFLVQLPQQKPIQLVFANAIRDNTDKEPPSDGVLFRVWAGEDRTGADSRLLFERFTAAKRWVEGKADLSEFAGKQILLRLESNPGPKHDTTCDSSFWATPTVVAGAGLALGKLLPPARGEAARSEQTAERCLAARSTKGEENAFLLGRSPASAGAAVALQPGKVGMLDGLVTMATAGAAASFRGFEVDIDEAPAGRWPSAWTFRGVLRVRRNDAIEWRHRFEREGETTELTLTFRAEGPGLRVSASCPQRISHFSVGPWDHTAERVYYGHGYCIIDPKPFRAGFGGHNLSSSHVGCDFAGGLSVLQAVDNPPNYFDVNPSAHRYAITTDQDCTLTLVPGDSAFGCAIAYRPLYDKRPAPAVPRLAGRMCFDIWGGRYADIADRMQETIRYGVTDSFLTVHVWQRWGYDYRLPDIWPPNPQFGTVEDMRRIGRVCRAEDIPWGLHDNYIDFYPDATGYSYRHIYFTRDGRPAPAWYNEGRDAQSYKWRPDKILPFVQRNLKLVREGVRPTHYFLDVFTSVGCVDWWDWKGNYHSGNESRKLWGETFAWIRDYLGGDAPTTSEAGHDQLIGYLDGADCQWMTLSPTGGRFLIRVPCQDWERTPWYDAVNHANFILHGVGYSSRYQGGRSREFHGINSDDYISAEALSGHALMVDAASWGRAAVRKYYLGQDLARRLALRHMTGLEYVGGDIHRQKATWDEGAVVFVNRGRRPWTVQGRALPQYGFLAQYGDGFWAAIERRQGKWAESSHGPSGWYCNARTVQPGSRRRLRIEPHVENFRDLGAGRFRWTMVWKAADSTPKEMRIFVHFTSEASSRRDKIAFQDDHAPPVATTQWAGRTLRIDRTVTLPADAEGEYEAMVGLYGVSGGPRAQLQGYDGGESRILVGKLHVTRNARGIAAVRFTPPPPAPTPPQPRLNPAGTVVDFGFAATDGAFRVQTAGDGLRVVPLPDSAPFDITLRLSKLAGKSPRVKAVAALDDGAGAPFTQSGEELRFRHNGKAFGYSVQW